MGRQNLLIIFISALAILAGAGLYINLGAPQLISAKRAPDSGITRPEKKTRIPEFDELVLKDLAYQPHHLNEWKNPLLIINLWAPWCAPCRREIPDLIALQKSRQDQVQIIGLSFDAVENVANFREKFHINYPLLLVQQESADINRFFGNSSSALPFTAILDARREIVYRHSGEINRDLLETEIRKQLAVASAQ